MSTTLTRATLIATLHQRIATAPTPAVGSFEVQERHDAVLLVWTADEADWPEDAEADAPWSQWGGNALLAGLPDPDDAGIDSWREGVHAKTAQWTQWNIGDDAD